MMIPPQFLDQLRSRLTLSDIIGKRIKVTRAGREFKACCPFHKEKTPSFTINDAKQFYHCFGCGAHGDVIKFVTEYDNLSFMDAVEALSAQVGLQVPKPSKEEVQRVKEQKNIHDLLEDTALYFQNELQAPKNQDALEYMLGRGLTPETLQTFRVGYAPADSDELLAYLRSKDYKDTQMIEAGVMRKSKKAGQSDPYGFFRDRIMFPVADKRGRIVAFGGRILPEHMRPPQRSNYKPPKYINSSDTPVFNKSYILYGENFARQAAGQGQSVVVVEGYLDVIACHQAGVQGAVAPMGTALTENQIASLWNMIPESHKVPILCFDGDNAGRRAAGRACERILPLLKADHSAKFAFLPQGEDPDTLIKNAGLPAFQNILAQSLPVFDYVWESHTAGRDFESPEAKAGFTKALEEIFKTIADRDLQLYYLQELRQKVSETFFARTSYRKGASQGRGASSGYRQKPKQSLKLRRPVNRSNYMGLKILMAGVLNYPHIYEQVEQEFGSFNIQDHRFDALRQSVVMALSDDPDLDAGALRSHLIEAGFEKEVGDILHESVYVHASFCAPPQVRDKFEDGSDTLVDDGHVQKAWFDFYNSIQNRVVNDEIMAGWKNAFSQGNEQAEERVKQVLHSHLSQEAAE